MSDLAGTPVVPSAIGPSQVAAPNAQGQDWGTLLDQAAQTSGKPLSNTPAGFANFYAPVANSVAQQTGIDPNTILGQWGLETGWGKSVISGTNNLGNMKVPKGASGGVTATDNQTGSSDAYQAFPDANSFANAYTNLLTNNYPGALNTGTDANATAKALAAGGYASDPHYASKLTAAAATVAQARGLAPTGPQSGSGGAQAATLPPAVANGATNVANSGTAPTNWGAALDAVGAGSPSPTNLQPNDLGIVPMDQFNKAYGISPQTPAPATNSSGGAITSTLAGIGQGFGNSVLDAQALVGKGLQALGTAGQSGNYQGAANAVTNAGNWLLNDAQTGKAAHAQQMTAAGADNTAGKIGDFIGGAVPYLVAPEDIGAQVAAGSLMNAGTAASNNQPILPAAEFGAGMGAVGAVGARLLNGAIGAAVPAAKSAINAIRGGENSAVANIGSKLGDQIDPTIANLTDNSNELIPGSLPTAAEVANNPTITATQRALQNTAAGQEAFPARAADNNAARLNTGQAVVGPDIDAEAQTFTSQQAARVAQGQSELPPIDEAQAATMQTPAYSQAINAANDAASNSGSSAFADQSNTVQGDLANQINAIAGTPDTLAAARGARSAQAADDYLATHVGIPTDAPGFDDLMARPGVQSAISQAGTQDGTRLGLNAPTPYTVVGGSRRLQVLPSGALDWVNVGGQQMVSGQTLASARALLQDQANVAERSGASNSANALGRARDALTSFIDENVPGYSEARANYAAASAPIDAQAALQARLNGAVDPLTNTVNPTKLRSTINSIQAEQMKPGLRPADRVTSDQLAALSSLGQQAQQASTNMVGLNGQGQEFIRQALDANAQKTTSSLANLDARTANGRFQDYLSANSPSYQKYFDSQNSTGVDIAARQQLAQALDKIGTGSHNVVGDPSVQLQAVRSLVNSGKLSGSALDYSKSLLTDLQRASSANAPLGAAGSQTAANLQLGGGLLAHLLSHKLGSGALMATAMTGHFASAGVALGAKTALDAANAKTEQAAINLFLNPKKLAAALEQWKNQPTAKAVFLEALKSKARGAGAAGRAAVQTYNTTQTN